MLQELVLELTDGRETRICFLPREMAASVQPCEGINRCFHQVSPKHAALLFEAVEVEYDGNPIQSAQKVILENKGELLFQALHTTPAFLDNSFFLTVLPTWDEESTKELLELYLVGFTPLMLSKHFQIEVRAIVRKLCLEVFGDEHLAADRTKPRHQKSWHREEMRYLASQMQIGRTPTEISALMDRDALGIAFKLFEALPVPIPRRVLNKYDIAIRTEPLGPVPLDGKPF